MAIARAAGQTPQGTGANPATTLDLVFPQNVVAGNFMCITAMHRQASPSASDNLSNTYDAPDLENNVLDGDSEGAIITCKKLTTGGSCTVTVNFGGSGRCGAAGMEYEGFGAGGAELGETNTFVDNVGADATTGLTGQITTTVADSLLIGLICNSSGTNPNNWNSPFNNVEDMILNGRADMGDQIVAATGTYEGTLAFNSPTDYAGLIASYHAAGGGGAAPVLGLAGHGNSDEFMKGRRGWL